MKTAQIVKATQSAKNNAHSLASVSAKRSSMCAPVWDSDLEGFMGRVLGRIDDEEEALKHGVIGDKISVRDRKSVRDRNSIALRHPPGLPNDENDVCREVRKSLCKAKGMRRSESMDEEAPTASSTLNRFSMTMPSFFGRMSHVAGESEGNDFVMDLARLETAHHSNKLHWYMIDPTNNIKVGWDLFVGGLIIYSVLSIPYTLCFDIVAPQEWVYFDIVVDCFFAMDILSSFNTAFRDKEGDLIWDPHTVRIHYLKSWFLIDFCSTFPFGETIKALTAGDGQDDDLSSLKLVRSLRLIRFLKLARLFKMKRLLEIIEVYLHITPSLMNIFKLLIKIVFIVHFLSCVWFAVSYPACPQVLGEDGLLVYDCSEMSDSLEIGWLLYRGIHEGSPNDQYLASFYFTTASVMAVGYGDIWAHTTSEKGIAILIQVIGASMFGFVMAAITSFLEAHNPRISEQNQLTSDVTDWGYGRDLPKKIRLKIGDHFTYVFSEKNELNDEDMLHLPAHKRLALFAHLHSKNLHRFAFFKARPPLFACELAARMAPFWVNRDEVIMAANETARNLYFVKRGRVDAYSENNLVVAEYWPGEHFLDTSLIPQKEKVSSLEYRAARRCDLVLIPRVDIRFAVHGGMFLDNEQKASCIGNAQKHQIELEKAKEEATEAEGAPPDARGVYGPLVVRGYEALDSELPRVSIYATRDPMSPCNQGGDRSGNFLGNRRQTQAHRNPHFKMPGHDFGPRLKSEVREERRAKRRAFEAEAAVSEQERQSAFIARHSQKVAAVRFSLPTYDGPSLASGNSSVENLVEPENPVEPFSVSAKPLMRMDTEPEWKPKVALDADGNPKEPVCWLSGGIIGPEMPWKLGWDVFLGMLICYSVVIIPYRIGFGQDATGAVDKLDICVDIFFALDMFFTARMAFFEGPEILVTDPTRIMINYAKSWFVIDLLSTLPIDRVARVFMETEPEGFEEDANYTIIGGNDDDADSIRSVKLLRTVRLFRLLKLMRLLRMSRLWGSVSRVLDFNPVVMLMWSFFVKLGFCAHMIGCFWFYNNIMDTEGETWWEGLTDEETYPDTYNSVGEQYLISVYWAFTTMTTVGYGDVGPSTQAETIFAICIMFFGATIFGYIVGSIANLSDRSGNMASLIDRRSIEFKDFLEDKLPRKLQKEEGNISMREKQQDWTLARDGIIKAITENRRFSMEHRSPYEEARILLYLSPQLRYEIVAFIHANILPQIGLFSFEPDEDGDGEKIKSPLWFVSEMMAMLKPQFFLQGDHIVGQADIPDRLYLLLEGEAEELAFHPGDRIECIAIYQPRSLICSDWLYRKPSKNCIRSTTRLKTFTLDASDVRELDNIDEHESDMLLGIELRKAICKAKRDQETSDILLQAAKKRTEELQDPGARRKIDESTPHWVTLAVQAQSNILGYSMEGNGVSDGLNSSVSVCSGSVVSRMRFVSEEHRHSKPKRRASNPDAGFAVGSGRLPPLTVDSDVGRTRMKRASTVSFVWARDDKSVKEDESKSPKIPFFSPFSAGRSENTEDVESRGSRNGSERLGSLSETKEEDSPT